MARAVLLNKKECEFVYYQLSARKQQLNEELLEWAEQKNTQEIIRVSTLINQIDETMKKIIG